jgi:hypothetical protein
VEEIVAPSSALFGGGGGRGATTAAASAVEEDDGFKDVISRVHASLSRYAGVSVRLIFGGG